MDKYDDLIIGSLASIIGGVSYLFKNKIRRMLTKKKSLKKLLYHDMFITADNVKGKVDNITCLTKGREDVVKTRLLHILIDLKIKSVKNGFGNLLLDKSIENMNGQRLKFQISKTLNAIVDEYNTDAFVVFVSMGINEKDARHFINGYEKHRAYIVEGFLDRLESITLNNSYKTNHDKLSAVLEVIAISLYVIPNDVISAMEEVNGRYLKYEDRFNF